MKILWAIVVGLGLLWFAVAAAVGTNPGPKATPTPSYKVPDPPAGSAEQLTERAKALAIARVPSGATLTPISTTKKYYKGDDLKDASPSDPNAVAGYRIVFEATVAGKPVSRITVNTAPPDKVVFVQQESVP